jgi:hypothetical protein
MRQIGFWKVILTAALTLSLLLVLLPASQPAWAAIYNVTNTNDSGTGSLRWAIDQANINTGPDSIHFNISGCGGVCLIQPTSALPTLADDGTTIDGYTQPGTARATDTTTATILIQIDGTNAGFVRGLQVTSGDNLIEGLAITNFQWDGVLISGSGALSNTLAGNYIATNDYHGVAIMKGAQNNTVGGDTAGERNVISGNGQNGVYLDGSGTTGNVVSGNYIGTDASGTTDLGNTQYGVQISGAAQNNTVGGDAAGKGNVISGNDWSGICITGSGTTGNVVSGNYIGTDPAGTADLGNSSYGVVIQTGAQGNAVGGNTATERNVISGNDAGGIVLSGSGTMSNTVSGNYIGTDVTGTADLGNTGGGVTIMSNAQSNTIGGGTAAERNVISGNGQYGLSIRSSGTAGNIVSGNYIGTDATGTADLGNSLAGVCLWLGAQDNTVGGDTTGERNVISGNGGDGVTITNNDTTGNIVSGNYIGTTAVGTTGLGNDGDGVNIYNGAQDNTVGGNMVGEGNVISGNGDGIRISGSGTMSNTVSGNYIGTDAASTADLGNLGCGVYIESAAQNNTLGPDNVIFYNDLDGVRLAHSTTTGNVITQNSIFANDQEGIVLATSANGNILPPTILTATLGSVHIEGTACPGCTVELFENSDTDGEGESYLGSDTADGSGVFSMTVSYLSQRYLTATATDVVSGTSEFCTVFDSGTRKVFLPLVLKNH